jgi:hypothetical protein
MIGDTMKKLALLVASLLALPAFAGPDFSYGPSMGLVRVHLKDALTGKASQDVLNAGAGAQFMWSFFPAQFPILNQKLDLFSIGAAAFYEHKTDGSLTSFSVAGMIGTGSGLLTLGFGPDLWAKYYGQDPSGVFTGNVSKVNLFMLLSMDLFRLYEVIKGVPTLDNFIIQILNQEGIQVPPMPPPATSIDRTPPP